MKGFTKPEEREEWTMMINEPIVRPSYFPDTSKKTGRPAPTPAELQADSDAFMAAMKNKGG